jgi:hypothetical protein
MQRIEIRRAHAYYAQASCGEHVGFGDSLQEAVTDLLSEMGLDAHAVDTWHIGTMFERGEPYIVLAPDPAVAEGVRRIEDLMTGRVKGLSEEEFRAKLARQQGSSRRQKEAS